MLGVDASVATFRFKNERERAFWSLRFDEFGSIALGVCVRMSVERAWTVSSGGRYRTEDEDQAGAPSRCFGSFFEVIIGAAASSKLTKVRIPKEVEILNWKLGVLFWSCTLVIFGLIVYLVRSTRPYYVRFEPFGGGASWIGQGSFDSGRSRC